MIGFEANDVISPRLLNLSRNVFLSAHGIESDDTALDVE